MFTTSFTYSFLILPYLFNIEGVSSFLGEKFSLEKFSVYRDSVVKVLRTQQLPEEHPRDPRDQGRRYCRGCKRKSYSLELADLDTPLQKRYR